MKDNNSQNYSISPSKSKPYNINIETTSTSNPNEQNNKDLKTIDIYDTADKLQHIIAQQNQNIYLNKPIIGSPKGNTPKFGVSKRQDLAKLQMNAENHNRKDENSSLSREADNNNYSNQNELMTIVTTPKKQHSTEAKNISDNDYNPHSENKRNFSPFYDPGAVATPRHSAHHPTNTSMSPSYLTKPDYGFDFLSTGKKRITSKHPIISKRSPLYEKFSIDTDQQLIDPYHGEPLSAGMDLKQLFRAKMKYGSRIETRGIMSAINRPGFGIDNELSMPSGKNFIPQTPYKKAHSLSINEVENEFEESMTNLGHNNKYSLHPYVQLQLQNQRKFLTEKKKHQPQPEDNFTFYLQKNNKDNHTKPGVVRSKTHESEDNDGKSPREMMSIEYDTKSQLLNKHEKISYISSLPIAATANNPNEIQSSPKSENHAQEFSSPIANRSYIVSQPQSISSTPINDSPLANVLPSMSSNKNVQHRAPQNSKYSKQNLPYLVGNDSSGGSSMTPIKNKHNHKPNGDSDHDISGQKDENSAEKRAKNQLKQTIIPVKNPVPSSENKVYGSPSLDLTKNTFNNQKNPLEQSPLGRLANGTSKFLAKGFSDSNHPTIEPNNIEFKLENKTISYDNHFAKRNKSTEKGSKKTKNSQIIIDPWEGGLDEDNLKKIHSSEKKSSVRPYSLTRPTIQSEASRPASTQVELKFGHGQKEMASQQGLGPKPPIQVNQKIAKVPYSEKSNLKHFYFKDLGTLSKPNYQEIIPELEEGTLNSTIQSQTRFDLFPGHLQGSQLQPIHSVAVHHSNAFRKDKFRTGFSSPMGESQASNRKTNILIKKGTKKLDLDISNTSTINNMSNIDDSILSAGMNTSYNRGNSNGRSPSYNGTNEFDPSSYNEMSKIKIEVHRLTTREKDLLKKVNDLNNHIDEQNTKWSNKMESLLKKYKNAMAQQKEYYENILKKEREEAKEGPQYSNSKTLAFKSSFNTEENQIMLEAQQFINEMNIEKTAYKIETSGLFLGGVTDSRKPGKG